MIGISFYLNDPKAEKRIEFAGKLGVKRGFTSLHIPEESGDLANRAKQLLQTAQEFGVEVYADVSARTPGHLGLKSLKELKTLGVIGLRLDDFFEKDMILDLAQDFKLALNASIMFADEVQELLAGGLNAKQLIAWHNFYPRRETGLSQEFFCAQNTLFKQFGIPVSAYIPGDGEKRGPMHEGLPTLEDHRETGPFLAALELFRLGVEDVYIGDPEASEELIRRLLAFDHGFAIRIEGALKGDYRLRPDFSRDVLRLMDTRSSEPVIPSKMEERPIGTITMDNDHYGRYRGEIQITLRDLPADDRVNVIGKVAAADLPLLSNLKPGQIVKFVQA